MTRPSTPSQALQQRAGALIITEGWPAYGVLRAKPEWLKWQVYEFVKRLRAELEGQGCIFVESYDAFVRRITQELDL